MPVLGGSETRADLELKSIFTYYKITTVALILQQALRGLFRRGNFHSRGSLEYFTWLEKVSIERVVVGHFD